MAKPQLTRLQKFQISQNKLLQGLQLRKPKVAAPSEREKRAAKRGHAGGEYHYGRVTAIRDDDDNIISHRVGPVPDTSGETYRGARQAALQHVVKMLKREKEENIVLSAYGRLYPGNKQFRWIGEVMDREQAIRDLEASIDLDKTPEEAANELFDMVQMPDLILAWEVRTAH